MKLDPGRAETALVRIEVAERPAAAIAPELVDRSGMLMRENISSGETPLGKAWLQTIVDRVEVHDNVSRIVGERATLEIVIAAAYDVP